MLFSLEKTDPCCDKYFLLTGCDFRADVFLGVLSTIHFFISIFWLITLKLLVFFFFQVCGFTVYKCGIKIKVENWCFQKKAFFKKVHKYTAFKTLESEYI